MPPAIPPPPTFTDLAARARVLTVTAPTATLTLDQAATVTGLPTDALTDLALRGDLLTEQTRPFPVFSTKGVLAWMDDHRVAVTALDALAYALPSADRLDGAAHALDEAAHRAARPGTVWRLEARSRLIDSHDAALTAWHRGYLTEAVNLLAGERDVLAARRMVDASRTVDLRTLWAVGASLTRHQRFLLHALRVQGRAGYPVHVLDTAGHPGLLRHGTPPTLTVYPRRVVYVHLFTDHGTPDGALRVADPELATALGALLDHLGNTARPISEFARLHG